MASADKLAILEADVEASISEVGGVLAKYEAKKVTLAELRADIGAEVVAAEEKGFEEGLAQAGQAGGSDKIYSDAEVNEMLAPIRAELEGLKMDKTALEAKVAELEGHVDVTPFAQADIDAAVEAATAPLKEQIVQLSLSAADREAMEEAIAKQAVDLAKAISDLTPSEVVA